MAKPATVDNAEFIEKGYTFVKNIPNLMKMKITRVNAKIHCQILDSNFVHFV